MCQTTTHRLWTAFLFCCLTILLAGASAHAGTVTWDGSMGDEPCCVGDDISWNDKFNWDTDMVPTGVDDAVLTTGLVKVQDSFVAVAATLSAGTTELIVNGSLTVFGSFNNDTIITVVGDDDSPTSGASFRVGEGSTLDGEGEVLLRRTGSLGVAPATFGSTGAVAVTHGAAHTIRGEGVLSANSINNGLIKAEDLDGNPNSILVLGNTLQNNSIVRTSPSAGILIEGDITQTASGQVIADANIVEYRLGVISGGTLEAENGGSFLFPVDGTISNLNNNAPINVVTGGSAIDLFVTGSGITNNGTITINSNNMQGTSAINFLSTQTLDGSGEIVLNRGVLGATLSVSVGSVLTQEANHTIRGEGRISAELFNNGLVEATDANGDGDGTLVIANNPNGSANATNAHLFRASTNAMIDLNGRLDQTPTGRLIAGDGGTVQFRSATLSGGTLETEGSGVAVLSNTSTFENVTNKGILNIPGGSSEKLLSLRGDTFTNDGLVTVNSTGSNSAVARVTESLLLSGSGMLLLTEPFVFGSRLDINAGVTLTQASGHTIQGRGAIGQNADGTLINNGTLAGASSSELLDINSVLAGEGLVRNVFIDGRHSPGNPQTGNPTASVPIEGEYNFGNGPGINGDNRLIIEIGGTTPGDDYDQLVSTDPGNVVTIRTAGTTLDVSLIDGFVSSAGDMFTVITTAGTINGAFRQLNLPPLPVGRAWDPPSQTSQTLTLTVSCTGTFDFDCDGDVDIDDVTLFAACASGPAIPLTAGCENMDFDGDNDVDQRDFGTLQRCISGPGNPPDPGCASG